MLLDSRLKTGLLRFRDGSRRRNIGNLRYFSGENALPAVPPPHVSRFSAPFLPASSTASTVTRLILAPCYASFPFRFTEDFFLFLLFSFVFFKSRYVEIQTFSSCFDDILFLDDSCTVIVLIVVSADYSRVVWPIERTNE